jgi:hypothetical protein
MVAFLCRPTFMRGSWVERELTQKAKDTAPRMPRPKKKKKSQETERAAQQGC